MSSHANPSRDPANDDSMLGMANEILKKFLQKVDDMLPARVVSYDRATNRAQVIPLVRVITTANQLVERPQVASIPVLQYGGGGFLLSFPLKPGNLGWIKANDRDISLVLQSYADNAPNTRRMHSFSDALFIPDVMTGYTLSEEDAENAVLQSLDGSVRVSLWADRLKLVAPGGSVVMDATGVHIAHGVTITLAAPTVAIVGNLAQTGGNATMSGGLTATGEVTAAGIPLSTHHHTGVVPGGGNSGGPAA